MCAYIGRNDRSKYSAGTRKIIMIIHLLHSTQSYINVGYIFVCSVHCAYLLHSNNIILLACLVYCLERLSIDQAKRVQSRAQGYLPVRSVSLEVKIE